MRAGNLNCRVVILRREKVRLTGGQLVEEWVEHARTWANVAKLTGLGTIKAESDVSLVKASYRVRYRRDLTAAMRLAHDGAIYDIKAVLPDHARREYVDLVCQSIPGETA
jgi:SPP1 family predicted phage head-tail adaptor